MKQHTGNMNSYFRPVFASIATILSKLNIFSYLKKCIIAVQWYRVQSPYLIYHIPWIVFIQSLHNITKMQIDTLSETMPIAYIFISLTQLSNTKLCQTMSLDVNTFIKFRSRSECFTDQQSAENCDKERLVQGTLASSQIECSNNFFLSKCFACYFAQ